MIYGAVRDVQDFPAIDLGIQALLTHPRKSVKRGLGDRSSGHLRRRYPGARRIPMPTIMASSRRRQRCSDGLAMAEKGKNATKALARALELNDPAQGPAEDKLDNMVRAERGWRVSNDYARSPSGWTSLASQIRTWPKRCAYPMVESFDFGPRRSAAHTLSQLVHAEA